jgi:hypothetical protein
MWLVDAFILGIILSMDRAARHSSTSAQVTHRPPGTRLGALVTGPRGDTGASAVAVVRALDRTLISAISAIPIQDDDDSARLPAFDVIGLVWHSLASGAVQQRVT